MIGTDGERHAIDAAGTIGSMTDWQAKVGEERFFRVLTPPRYRALRGRLLRIFARRGCSNPEDLADETISRVMSKVGEISAGYEGDPIRYFYGVARNVYLEYLRRPRTVSLEESGELAEPTEKGDNLLSDTAFGCLERCLKALDREERDLIGEYYRHEKGAKIEHRKALAARLGVGLNALRIRAYRVRQKLQKCVLRCLGDDGPGKMK